MIHRQVILCLHCRINGRHTDDQDCTSRMRDAPRLDDLRDDDGDAIGWDGKYPPIGWRIKLSMIAVSVIPTRFPSKSTSTAAVAGVDWSVCLNGIENG